MFNLACYHWPKKKSNVPVQHNCASVKLKEKIIIIGHTRCIIIIIPTIVQQHCASNQFSMGET